MAIQFHNSKILFNKLGEISFNAGCCCSSVCSRCDTDKSPVVNQLQVLIEYVGAGTGIAQGNPGCEGGAVCNDYDLNTYILDRQEVGRPCTWIGDMIDGCDNIFEIELTIEPGTPTTDNLFVVDVIHTGDAQDGHFTKVVNGNPLDCLDTLDPMSNITKTSDSQIACVWTDVEMTVTTLF